MTSFFQNLSKRSQKSVLFNWKWTSFLSSIRTEVNSKSISQATEPPTSKSKQYLDSSPLERKRLFLNNRPKWSPLFPLAHKMLVYSSFSVASPENWIVFTKTHLTIYCKGTRHKRGNESHEIRSIVFFKLQTSCCALLLGTSRDVTRYRYISVESRTLSNSWLCVV